MPPTATLVEQAPSAGFLARKRSGVGMALVVETLSSYFGIVLLGRQTLVPGVCGMWYNQAEGLMFSKYLRHSLVQQSKRICPHHACSSS